MALRKTVLGAPSKAPAGPPQAAVPAAGESADEQGSRVLELDLTGVSTDFEAMPVGLYTAVVSEVIHVPISKKSGKPYVKFTFEITSEDYLNRKQFMNCSLAPQALWKLVKVLDSLGIEADAEQLKLNLDDLVGLACVLSLSVEDYQGRTKNVVMEVLPAATVTGIPSPF